MGKNNKKPAKLYLRARIDATILRALKTAAAENDLRVPELLAEMIREHRMTREVLARSA